MTRNPWTIVDPIRDRFDGNPHPYSRANLEPDANLSGADLRGAYWHFTTFSTGTILDDGQTVLQHGFDAAGLEAYLEASPAMFVQNLIIVPEPTTLLLTLLALTAAPLRVRCGCCATQGQNLSLTPGVGHTGRWYSDIHSWHFGP
jgi:hypothetical protein